MLSLDSVLVPDSALKRFVQSTLCLQNLKISVRLLHFTMQDYFKLKDSEEMKVYGNFVMLKLHRYYYSIFMPGSRKTQAHVNITGIHQWDQIHDAVTRLNLYLAEKRGIQPCLQVHGKNCSIFTVDNLSMSGGLPDFHSKNYGKRLDLWKFMQFLKSKPFVRIRFFMPHTFPALMLNFRLDPHFSFYRPRKLPLRRGMINIFPSKGNLKKVNFQGFKSAKELIHSYLLLMSLFLEYASTGPRVP